MNHHIKYKFNSSHVTLDDIISATNTGKLPLVRVVDTPGGGSITRFTIWPSPRWPFTYVAGEIHQKNNESGINAQVVAEQPFLILAKVLLNRFVLIINLLIFFTSITIIANPYGISATLEGKYIEMCYLFVGFSLLIYPAIYLIRINNQNLFKKITNKLEQLHGQEKGS